MQKERVLVTGASGFIGSNLLDYLLEKDYEVIGLSRQKNLPKIHPHLTWIRALEELKHDRIDYVVNLAGESIAQGRWTDTRKQKLIASRVETTTMLYQYLAKRNIQPKCIISGSAVGYYGIDPTEQWTECCNEQSAPQSIFMSELCQKWEQSARQDTSQNTKIIRLGVVFGRGAGILPQMLFPIKMNLCGRIGSGRQPVVWVHIQDVLRAIEFLMLHETTEQVFNVVSPEKVTQSAFAQTAAKILKRRPVLSLPAVVLKLLLGEQSQLVLNGQFVRPEALKAQGFEFKYPTLKEALIKKFTFIQSQNTFFKEAFKEDDYNSLTNYDYRCIYDFYKKKIETKTTIDPQLDFLLQMYCHGSIEMTKSWVEKNMYLDIETLVNMLIESMPERLKQYVNL